MQNKPVCLVASYGGSGSTYLTKLLKTYASQEYAIAHTHTVPVGEKLGAPVFNLYTGHIEGPMSPQRPLPAGSKVIYIYRDPAEAYLSRRGFKHFMHLWSGTSYQDELFGTDKPTQETFQPKMGAMVRAGQDVMRYHQHAKLWRDFAQSGKSDADILFLKYENLERNLTAMFSFLGLKRPRLSKDERFSARGRDVPENIAQMFAQAREEFASWGKIEEFPAGGTSEPYVSPFEDGKRITLKNASFSCAKLGAGASDAISRMGNVYDIMTRCFDIDFIAPDYVNYHSPELDFLELFGVYDAFPKEIPGQETRKEVHLSLTEVIHHIMYDTRWFTDDTHYVIQPMLYDGAKPIGHFKRQFGLKPQFKKLLTYKPTQDPFADDGSVKVVAHLRRQDIIGGVLFEGPEGEAVPEKTKRGVHSRPLLDLETVVAQLENEYPAGTKIQMIVASDGVEKIRKHVARYEGMTERLDAIMADVMKQPQSDKLDIDVKGYVIGVGSEETLQTLDAMYLADLVVTASSTFPRLPCSIGGAKIIKVLFN